MSNENLNRKKGKLWNKIGGSSNILYCIIFFFGFLFLGKIILSYFEITMVSQGTVDSILLVCDLIITYIFYTFINKKK